MAELDDLFHTDQYVGPERLTDLCFKLICENLDIISIKGRRGHRILRKGITFPSEICDKIIEYAQYSEATEDDDCFFSIFKNLAATRLKHVKISSCSLTDTSVQTLTSHKLYDLELTDCSNLTELCIEHINANSENLHSLAFHGTSMIVPSRLSPAESSFDYYKRGYVFKTPNLRRLALGYLGIAASEYVLLLAGLINLTHLDLSNSFDIDTFEFYHLVPNLVSLTLYNVKVNTDSKSFVKNISQLKNLRHLDISQSNYKHGQFENPNRVLADLVNGLPQLVSLDIGGTNLAGRGVAERPIDMKIEDTNLCQLSDIPGLASRIHKPLQFLGLYGTAHGACRRHDIPAKVVAGDANEDQILIAAHVCMDNKQELLQKVLSDLYHVFRYENCHRMDQALCTVLEAMEKHPAQKHIQISGSATLFYIVKMKEKGELVARMKRRIISTLLAGMSAHRDEETMMRNGCLALCQFRIPQDVMSNYEALVKVLLHSARHSEPESFVQRIGIYLLNSLACQVEGKEKRLLGKLGCVKTMLELVEYRVESNIFDDVLEVAWSTMWNMTDETSINCQRFLDEKGMALFLLCVKQYPHKEELLRNMMGLLGNVAEVEYLRIHLMQERYVTVFANLLRSNSDGIEVPYNAAGILAHMASDGLDAWTIEKPTRNEVLKYMVQAIESWDLNAERNINYRSFGPLLRLLDVYHTPPCQHWAAWALANLTKVYPFKYCTLVVKEGGMEKLHTLIADSRPYERIKELANLVIENCCQYESHSDDVNVSHSALDAEYSLDG
ncbi:protein zer-1 homolog isoform X2 [Linepithema humile]|uniref:protein zer-1 homolog isoform X2 n=1 Tax=Linepithema humile TaxID=83485 RepID=UPI00062397DE|nr:PREDICTED: protein zer-1 homolog [Linepithema humile]XP_012224119.1 PREDICTED: protein zer-1 homolog [Linepithema humile]XP_012224120.1 PREDICTED: protein zer-1 homolog [Linepithema humile]XP_012224121.1 PREDICTED: protein zer-1 homolog [Linepithema humile]